MKTAKFAEIDNEWQKRNQEARKKPNKEPPQAKDVNTSMKEMGLLHDGRAIGSLGNILSEKTGIGANEKEDVIDVTQFRMNMSLKYQQINEERAKGVSETARCYICQGIGHQAKD